MAKWYNVMRKVKASKNDNRFYSSRDMSELKRMTSVSNAKSKREKKKSYSHISVCGCGMEGCFIVR